MPNASNAKLQVEQGQSLVAYAALTDSGDHQYFTPAAAILSGKSGYEPDCRPNGIVSGANLVSPAASGSDDVVDVAAFTAYSQGVLNTVAASADESITRPATDVSKVCSITMSSAGAIAVVAGDDGTTAAFSETRGAAGGPPEIPADSVELAQVRLTAAASAAVTASEIFQVVGQHAERYDFPTFEVSNIGLGASAGVAAAKTAHVKFAAALPLSHASATAKKVYLQYYTPTLGDISKSVDFVPVETTHSVGSSQYYGGTSASKSSSLGQGGFKALVSDGVSDTLAQQKNEVLTFKFFPDRNKTPYILTQGTLGIARAFPVAADIAITATITAEEASAEFTS